MRSSCSVTLWTCLTFLLWTCATLNEEVAASTSPIPILMHMREELPLGTVIGNIFDRLPMKMARSSKILLREHAFFEVVEGGDVRVKRVIDRESICSRHKQCCGAEDCSLKLDLFVSDSNDMGEAIPKTIRLSIYVNDENDEKPTFPAAKEMVQISETAPLGTLIPLTPATDADVTKDNQIRQYKMDDKLSQTFTLEQPTESSSLALRTTKRLDYESTKMYVTNITACDQTFCSSKEVVIEVINENDHSPMFTQLDYAVDVPENQAPMQEVLRVNATDVDEEVHGKITYFIFGSPDEDLLNTFSLNANTGSIYLKPNKTLSIDVREQYVFQIMARDSGSPAKTSTKPARVTIRLMDVNDSPPEISIISLKEGKLTVPENGPPRVVATLLVQDKDRGENARFHCSLQTSSAEESPLKLSKRSDEMYVLETTQTLDYEKEVSYSAVMRCQDNGKPPQESQKTLTVHVLDENEFPPTFERTIYEAKVPENSPAGVLVLEVKATDRDRGANLRYLMEGSKYFTIDQQRGRIETSLVTLDREEVQFLEFTVHVFDSEVEPRQSFCTVKVVVLDQNDNDPVFETVPSYQVKENLPRFTALGPPLMASDKDIGRNSEIRYYLLSTFSNGIQLPNNYFRITESGQLETTTPLDRETYDSFILEIEASDSGQKRRTALTNVSVEVLDENDNSPEFVSPSRSQSVRNVSLPLDIGAVVYNLSAIDKDEGPSGQVMYYLEHRQNTECFEVNNTTGKLSIRCPLDPFSYTLHLGATDMGTPRRSATILLHINVMGDVINLSTTVIILMVALTALISLILLTTIICVRRKPSNYPGPIPPSNIYSTSVAGETLKPKQAPAWNYQPGEVEMLAAQMAPPHETLYYDEATDSVDPTGRFSMTGAGVPQYYLNSKGLMTTRRPYDLDHDSGDSGRGTSEHEADPSHLALLQQQYGGLDPYYMKNARRFGSLQRPNRANSHTLLPFRMNQLLTVNGACVGASSPSPTLSPATNHPFYFQQSSQESGGIPMSFPGYNQNGRMSATGGIYTPTLYPAYDHSQAPNPLSSVTLAETADNEDNFSAQLPSQHSPAPEGALYSHHAPSSLMSKSGSTTFLPTSANGNPAQLLHSPHHKEYSPFRLPTYRTVTGHEMSPERAAASYYCEYGGSPMMATSFPQGCPEEQRPSHVQHQQSNETNLNNRSFVYHERSTPTEFPRDMQSPPTPHNEVGDPVNNSGR